MGSAQSHFIFDLQNSFGYATPSAIKGLSFSTFVTAAVVRVKSKLFAQVTALFHRDPQDE